MIYNIKCNYLWPRQNLPENPSVQISFAEYIKRLNGQIHPKIGRNLKKLRNKTTQIIRDETFYDNIAVKLTSNSISSKGCWSILKSFKKTKTNNKASIPPIEDNDQIHTNEHDKANILNSFFQSQSFLNDRDAPLPAILPTTLESELNIIVLTTDEVESVLKILPVGKATGPNGLSNHILRELSHELSTP